MGRETRRVPEGWEHPKDQEGKYIALYDSIFQKAACEWDSENKQWDKVSQGCTYAEYEGERPEESWYMPEFREDQLTQIMMYETCSEGTPISPAFDTPEELAKWLADNGASAFGDMTATYEQWLSTCKRGWAPSAVLEGGKIKSGVETS